MPDPFEHPIPDLQSPQLHISCARVLRMAVQP
jgi:hypothetical protein